MEVKNITYQKHTKGKLQCNNLKNLFVKRIFLINKTVKEEM